MQLTEELEVLLKLDGIQKFNTQNSCDCHLQNMPVLCSGPLHVVITKAGNASVWVLLCEKHCERFKDDIPGIWYYYKP